jgi:hypothetical protein
VSIRPRGPARAQQPAAGGEVQPNELQQLAAQMGFGGGRGAQTPNVVPAPPPGTQYRFYWNTPVLISPHNPSIIYVGGDRLFKSVDRGDHWTASPDLTKNISRFDRPILGVGGKAPMASKHDGAAAYSNIITISESPAVPGILWVGTNDGNLQVSRDGGSTWKNVVDNVPGVPRETHVSRVEASHFDAGTCYVTFDGHRTDDHKPYVFVTRDYGQTWTSIAADLPAGNVNVIREDPTNRNLLFLGTEYAFYVSLNGGGEWKRFMTGLPTVRIDDILVHPRDNDLIVGTHGRSIYIIDDITALQQLSDEVMKTDVHLFDVRPAVSWITDTTRATYLGGQRNFRGENPPRGTMISYYLRSVPAGDVKIEISDYTGRVVRTIDACAGSLTQGCATKDAGLNRVLWNLAGSVAAGGRGGAARGGQRGGAQAAAAGGRAGAGGQAGQAAGRGAAAGGAGGGGAAAAQFAQGGGGRGGFGGASLEPGTYLVKLTVGSTTLTTKAVIEADSLSAVVDGR